ncbi:MAG: hypothetical protein D6766_03290 [Verrucomicrobia bacterium]|nr:MAG: hypothetical protein D6766_03290 [Verrucomicrobiota bacterium]
MRRPCRSNFDGLFMRKRAHRLAKAWAAALVGAALAGFGLGPVLVAWAGEAALPAGDDPQPVARMDATATNTVPASAVAYLRRWLESPPWIQKAVWRVSGNSTRIKTVDRDGRTVDGGPVPGWMQFEGGIQPGGFYLKYGTNNGSYARWIFDRARNPVRFEIHNPAPGKEIVVGLGGDFYWHLWPDAPDENQGLHLAPREGTPGFDARNGTYILCRTARNLYLERLRRLGLWQLAEAPKIQWAGDGSFTAETAQHGLITGRILTSAAFGRPQTVKYTVTRPRPITFWVQYEFDTGMAADVAPRRFIEWSTYTPGVKVTNVLDVWQAGWDEQHRDGWRPSEFGAGQSRLVQFLLWSNGIPYNVTSDGRLAPAEVLSDRPEGAEGPSQVVAYRWTLILVAVLSLCLLVVRRFKRT